MIKSVERYKIRFPGGTDMYDVKQNGDISIIDWRNEKGLPFSLAYPTTEVITFLKKGLWIKIPSKTKRKATKSINLFNIDDL